MSAYFDSVFASIRNYSQEMWEAMEGWYATCVFSRKRGKEEPLTAVGYGWQSHFKVMNLGVVRTREGTFVPLLAEYRMRYILDEYGESQCQMRLALVVECTPMGQDGDGPGNWNKRYLFRSDPDRWTDVHHMLYRMQRYATSGPWAGDIVKPTYTCRWDEERGVPVEWVPSLPMGRQVQNPAAVVWRQFCSPDVLEDKETIAAAVRSLELDEGRPHAVAEMRKYMGKNEQRLPEALIWKAFCEPWLPISYSHLSPIAVVRRNPHVPFLSVMGPEASVFRSPFNWVTDAISPEYLGEEEDAFSEVENDRVSENRDC